MQLTDYASFFEIKGEKYLFHTQNCSLIHLDKKTYEILINNSVDKLNDHSIDILKTNNFLKKDKEYKYIRNKYLNNKYKDSSSLKIDIAVTNNCNFNCSYCFEKKQKTFNKSIDIKTKRIFKEKLCNYVFHKIISKNIKNITIVWYGGEPLIEDNYIIDINKIMESMTKKHNVKYEFIIISNGYLIDDNFIENFKNSNIKYIQITLDGTENIHDKRRKLLNEKSSYKTILNNVELLLSNKIETVIRINIDKENYISAENFIYHLYNIFGVKYVGKYLFLDIARVFGSDNSLSNIEYNKIKNKLWKKCVDLGFVLPHLYNDGIGVFCSAEADNSDIVVDIFGNIYKCWNYIFDKTKAYTSLHELEKWNYEFIPDNNNRIKYVEEVSLLNINKGKCLECKYIMFCKGLCPDQRLKILEGEEENIYINNACVNIIENFIITNIEKLLEGANL